MTLREEKELHAINLVDKSLQHDEGRGISWGELVDVQEMDDRELDELIDLLEPKVDHLEHIL